MKKILTLAIILISLCAAVCADFGVSKFTNPICGAADPCVVKNPDGKGYYFVYTNEQGVYTEFALSPADFKYDFSNRVYAPEPGTICQRNLWAPELHKIGGKWYIYFCSRPMGEINHRMCVISGDDPMKSFGNFTNMGDNNNGDSAIDQTVFEYKGRLYTCYAGRTDGCLRLMMAEMASPTEIKPKRVIISEPEYDWETHVDHTNEGPFVLERNGKLYIVYSASAGFTDEYCLGILTYKGGDLLDPASWEKHPKPILTGMGNIQATGHCTFTKDADGNDWCVFHCNRPHTEANMNKWVPRLLCLQPVIWINDFPTFSPVVEKPKYFKYEK